MSTLRGLLDIRPEERRNTFAAFAALFTITTGHTLLETARDALFLAKIPTSHLPWMYLVIVGFALGLSQLRAARADSKMGVAVSLVVAAGITAAFWALVPTRQPSTTALYALYVWTGLFASWAMVQFWTLLGRAHTMTQAKRLYGFIGAGSVLGAVVGALIARAAMNLSPRTSILFAAITFAAAAIPTLTLVLPAEEPAARALAAPDDDDGASDERRPWRASMGLLLENAFARRVLGIVLVSTVTVTIADFLFKTSIAETYRDPRELGRFLSTFYAATNVLALVAQLLIAPWLFRKQGVARALFVFPALLLGAATAVLVAGGRVVAAVALKALDGGLRYSIHKTSSELLLVPVPDGTRERIKPIIDLVGSRGGQALASIGILGLVAVSAAKHEVLGALVVALSLVWIGLVVTIRVLYLDVFRETLRSGGLSGKAELPELDLGALETLFAGLNSSHDGDVLASLELLAEQHRERLIPALILYHPSRDVVLRALDIFAEMGRADFVSIADRLDTHPDREVAAAALRARTAVAPDKALLEKRVAGNCAQVAVTALVALMARGWIAKDAAEALLGRVLEARSWRVAAELARAVRTMAPTRSSDADVEERFDQLLVELDEMADTLRDVSCDIDTPAQRGPEEAALLGIMTADTGVRLEVARAMSARRSPRFVFPLVRMLRRHELRATARAALVQIPGALEAVDLALSSDATPRDIRVHLPRTLSLFEPNAAARILLRHLGQVKSGEVRFKTIQALVKLRRLHPKLALERESISRVLDLTLDHAEQLRRWGAALTADDGAGPSGDGAPSQRSPDPLRAAHHLLVDLVQDKERHATQRLFLLLELTSGEEFDDIWRGLRSKSAKARASSLELLENLVDPRIRRRVLGLVGDRRQGEERLVPIAYEAAIREMVAHDSGTMRTLATYRAAELGIDVGAIAPRPTAEATELEATLAQRLLDTAKGILRPEPAIATGATRAPA